MKPNPTIFAFVCLALLLVACGCRHAANPDAALQQRLVGTWHLGEIEKPRGPLYNELTFTITRNGDYVSHVKNPEPHTILGTMKTENGSFVVTVTNIDGVNLPAPVGERETIIHLDVAELVVISERSNLTNRFRKIAP
jgi:hypothetical protein